MIEKNVRRFLARRSVAGMKDEGPENDGTILTAGKVYIEVRPSSGILRPEDAPVATYGLSLETVEAHDGIKNYFDELESIVNMAIQKFDYWAKIINKVVDTRKE